MAIPNIPNVWHETPNSGSISFSKDGVIGTRSFIVPWSDLITRKTYLDFIDTLIGQVVLDAVTGNPILTQPDVFSREYYWLICQEVKADPYDPQNAGSAGIEFNPNTNTPGPHTSDVADWPNPLAPGFVWGQPDPITGNPTPYSPRQMSRYALLTCKYAPREFEESLNITGQSFSMPAGTYGYVGSDWDLSLPANPATIVPGSQGVIIQQEEYSFECRQILTPDFFRIMNMVGKINGNATNPIARNTGSGQTYPIPIAYNGDGTVRNPPPLFPNETLISNAAPLQPFLEFPARTLLLESAEGRRTWLPAGVRCWNLRFRFRYNPYEFTKLFRPDTGRWEIVKATNFDRFIYDPWDFSDLERYRFYQGVV